jgi:hypothetical protein
VLSQEQNIVSHFSKRII